MVDTWLDHKPAHSATKGKRRKEKSVRRRNLRVTNKRKNERLSVRVNEIEEGDDGARVGAANRMVEQGSPSLPETAPCERSETICVGGFAGSVRSTEYS